MSHFARVRTQIREREHLVTALRELHYQCREGEKLVVRGFLDNKETAEVVVETGSKYDIGFRRSAQEYELVADWWGVERGSSIRQQSFLRQVNQQYSYLVVRAQALEQNLIVEEDYVAETGERVLILSERG